MSPGLPILYSSSSVFEQSSYIQNTWELNYTPSLSFCFSVIVTVVCLFQISKNKYMYFGFKEIFQPVREIPAKENTGTGDTQIKKAFLMSSKLVSSDLITDW